MTWDGENCIQCNSGKFPDPNDANGKCVNVTTTVTNCDLYSDGVTCTQCEKGFTL